MTASLDNPLIGERITRDHPQYDAVTAVLMRQPDLRVPAQPGTLRVPDGRVWRNGRELLVQVWQIGPDGHVRFNEAGDKALTEPEFKRIPLD